MDGFTSFLGSLSSMLTSWAIVDVFWATLLGIVVGMLPGLTATLGVALMTTLTFRMETDQAILILICMYVGAIYGGSRSAILLNIPGTPANAATSLDGYPLARAGKAGSAMAIATTGSMFGGLIGMVALAFIAPLLAEFALSFGAYEFFWLAVFGVLVSGQLTSLDNPIKGWIAGFLGLFVATIGLEGIHGVQRFSYGSTNLSGGIGLLPAMVGAFGFAEILTVMRQEAYEIVHSKADSVWAGIRQAYKYKFTALRSGLIGTFMGLIPGVGEDMGSWASYAAARQASRNKDEFGKGSVEGLLAAETGNNAAVPGALIPVLTLGVPGSAPAAVLLAAMIIHGIRPGPLIMIESPDFVFSVVAMVFLATIAMGILGLLLTRPLVMVLRVARERLMPVIFLLCTVGAFAIASRIFDIWVMLFFGLFGFILRELKYPMAPLILGIVLGDILDKSLRRGLVLSDGDIGAFFVRPVSMVLWMSALAFIILSMPSVRASIRRMRGQEAMVDTGVRQSSGAAPTQMDKLDFISSGCLTLFGLGVIFESLRLPRLEHLTINPYTVPGIVPGFLGVMLTLCGVAVLLRSISRGGWQLGWNTETAAEWLHTGPVKRGLLTLSLTLVFALVLFPLVPFFLAATIFVFAFVVASEAMALGHWPSMRQVLTALVLAVIAGAVIGYVFQELFYVRFPGG